MSFKNFNYSIELDDRYVAYIPTSGMPKMTSKDFVEFLDYLYYKYPAINVVNLKNNDIETLEVLKEGQNIKNFPIHSLLLSGNKLKTLKGIQYLSNNLKLLNVSDNQLTTLEFDEDGNNVNIKSLFLYGNNLNTLKGLRAFKSLSQLFVSENKLVTLELEDKRDREVAKGIQCLEVRNNCLSNLNGLEAFTSLTLLDSLGNSLEEFSEKSWDMKYLRSLSLEVKTPVEFKIPNIEIYKKIDTLILKNLIIPNSILENFKGTVLSLYNCKISYDNRTNLDAITDLVLEGNTFEEISDFLNNCTSLVGIALKDCKISSLDFLKNNPELSIVELERVEVEDINSSLQLSSLLDSLDNLLVLTLNETNLPFPKEASLTQLDCFTWQKTSLKRKFILD